MSSRRVIVGLAAAAVAGVGVAVAGNQIAARDKLFERAAAMTGGDPHAGRAAIEARGCGGCHQIPGVRGAAGKVGPPLSGVAGRAILAGRIDNSPDNLARWVQHPHRIDPRTAMPEMGVGEGEARDIAAYLMTLQ